MRRYLSYKVKGKGVRLNQSINGQAYEKSSNGNIPTQVAGLRVNISITRCYFSTENKFIIKIKPM